MSVCSISVDRPSRVRSALSNDPLRLAGIDGRSARGRRFRDLMRSYAEEVGGLDVISEPQRALCSQAAVLTVQVEALQARVIAGDVVDPELIVRIGNVQLRALAALGLKKGQHRVESGSNALANYLASLRQDEDALEEEPEVDAIAEAVDGGANREAEIFEP
jgi:hypothetical protein